MDVQDPSREGAHERRREDPHEPGETDELDPVLVEEPLQRRIIGRAVREVLGVEEDRGDPGPRGAREGRRPLAIRDDDDDGRGKALPARGVEDRLEVGAPAGREDADAEAVQATSSTPRWPATISPRR